MKKELLNQIQEWIDNLKRSVCDTFQTFKVDAELSEWREDQESYYFTVKIPKSKEMEKKKE